uniref:ATP synthase complex subunit 8 n=1 Tax=Melanosuchus niger TaxID=38656 RepID=A0A7L8ZVV6_MELNG|nr:ATP synthase F0 subunit 8 [Melanosuchus niger]QYA18190.1 ATP synthase F0 subunit 8 [Melanosuchus niger]
MPQLNPEPWLIVLLTTWTFFITILQPQTTSLTQTNNPSTHKPQTTKTWPWPWTPTYSTNS